MKRVYIREEFCIGCRLCEIYCQVEHSQSMVKCDLYPGADTPACVANCPSEAPVYVDMDMEGLKPVEENEAIAAIQ